MATTPETDRSWLRRTAALALRGFPAPNPRVGCVVVRDGAVVAEAHHDRAGGPHAEAAALAKAGALARGATLYVTLEPCRHHGRTPPCTDAIREAGVARVVYAEPDPNPEAAGGAGELRSSGVEAVREECPQAAAANAAWLAAVRRRRAFVFAKAALTADGFLARPDGTSRWITGPLARGAGHGLRAEAGSVLVGAGTAVADRPRLSVRSYPAVRQPARFVVDPSRRAAMDLGCEPGQSPPVRLVREGEEAGEQEAGVAGGLEPSAIAEAVFQLGETAVLVEGGAETLQRFFEAGAVDRLDLFVARSRFGGGLRLELPASLRLAASRELGGDAWLTFLAPGVPFWTPAWAEPVRASGTTNGSDGPR